MNKKLVNIASVLMRMFLLLVLLMSIAGIVLTALNNTLGYNETINYVYLLIGEALIPLEIVINKSLGGFNQASFVTFSISVATILVIICFLTLKDLAKVKKHGGENVKFNYISSHILLFLILGFFTFSTIVTAINYSSVLYYINIFKNEFVSNIGENIIALKFIVVSGLIIVLSLLTGISLMLSKKRIKKQIEVVGTSGINFYSSDYEEQVKETKIVSSIELEKDKKKEVKLTEKRQQAIELVSKVMELNQMKEDGQITAVEYTRLRQKAIRKYKK